MNSLISQVIDFIEQCKLKSDSWQYASTPGGPETLYASCFACMLYHYTGQLDRLTLAQKQDWVAYLNSWQDPSTGYFIGPELIANELHSPKHSYEHIAQHLAAHVLPVLSLLGEKPAYPLTFAHSFTNLDVLQKWLEERDWHDAWLEGNNLLFVGQFLVHLRDVEELPSAQPALDLYFEWLDREQDSATGLWGTNGYCSKAAALYGGYHQLLVYYYEKRPVQYPERLIDVALSLQHPDGGFNPRGGGGACEDTDAIDILVNMYKRVNYKRPQVRNALRKVLHHILQRQMSDGGFVYRLNEPFIHMGVQKTKSGPNQSNMFSTWFRVHTLALISEVLTDESMIQFDWRFNDSCSMGWHRQWNKHQHPVTSPNRIAEILVLLKQNALKKEWYKYHLKRFLPSQLIQLMRKTIH